MPAYITQTQISNTYTYTYTYTVHIQYIYSTYKNMIYNDILSLYNIYIYNINREGVMQPRYWRDMEDHHEWWLSVLTPKQIAEPGLCGNSPGILAVFFGLW